MLYGSWTKSKQAALPPESSWFSSPLGLGTSSQEQSPKQGNQGVEYLTVMLCFPLSEV